MPKRAVFAALSLISFAALGCVPAGPQSKQEFVSAYRAAHASGNVENVDRMIAWVEDVRPELEDPYEGGSSARLMTRKSIHGSLLGEATDGEPVAVNVIETPAEYRDKQIEPQPLYWVHIVRCDAGRDNTARNTFDIHDVTIRLPVIEWNGAHCFYGSPHYSLEPTFGLTGSTGLPKQGNENDYVLIEEYDFGPENETTEVADLSDKSP